MSEYASEEESNALIRKDERTPAMRKVDKMLEQRWALEQGSDHSKILYDIAVELMGRIEAPPPDCLKITMEQQGCLIEVVVPEKGLPSVMEMKEYMKNTGADMYARLYHMMQQMKAEDGAGHQDAP